MHRVDSRVGLSIDSGSESCASDLSDSQCSWDDETPSSEQALNATFSSVDETPFASNDSWHSISAEIDVRDLPGTPSFRNRLPQRRRRLTENSWDDDFRISRHPRAPSLRFCLTICTLTLVLMSLSSNSTHTTRNTQPQQYNIRREEVIRPIRQKSMLPAENLEGASPLRTYHAPGLNEDNSNRPVSASRPHGGATRQSHFAMARAAEQRPVFGAPFTSERFVVDEDESSSRIDESAQDPSESPHWTSWLAAFALLGMLVETGYKEYRQCRFAQVDQRIL